MIWKALFSALGLGSLFLILNSYGFPKLAQDLLSLGWWSMPLALSFLPVTACYAAAWLLVTPNSSISKYPRMVSLSIVGVAWNNLSPFVKILGEPIRVVLLEKSIPRRDAVKSVVLYNIVHGMGSLLSFFLCSLILLLFFPVSKGLHAGFLALVVISPLLTLTLFFLPRIASGMKWKKNRSSSVSRASFWVRWSLHKARVFARFNPHRFWFAILIEMTARFVEGLTFYVAFLALGRHVPLQVCALLDVGRTILDTIFFFIPYQVGSREGGILLLAEDAVRIGSDQAVSAAIFYRLVEVLWTGIGYLLWIKEDRAPKFSK